METVDILIAAFAVIAVVGSVAGAALYEAPEGGVEWQVAFSESDQESLQSQSDSTAVTASTTVAEPAFVFEHNVSAIGVTELQFDVTIDTDRALPRTGTVTYDAYLVAPDGTELRDGDAASAGNFDTSASFTLEVPAGYLTTVPEDRTVMAEDIPTARDQVNETLMSNATGVWEVHIHMTFGQGTAITAENVNAESTPKLRQVAYQVGTNLDIFTGA